jgi:hypothetical protein
MYYELLNNNHHRNNLALFKVHQNNSRHYLKLSLSKKSNLLINNEKKGYSWFYLNSSSNDKTKLIKNYYYEILIPEYLGKAFNSNAIISGNEDYIMNLIKFYNKIWSKNNSFAIHGDLALCNIIYNKNDIIIIDWEHFHFANQLYYGYDIVNLLFISLHHEFKGIKKIDVKVIKFIKECLLKLFEKVDKKNKILSKPFTNSSIYLKENKSEFNLNVPVEKKFVLSRYNKSELEELDSLFNN